MHRFRYKFKSYRIYRRLFRQLKLIWNRQMNLLTQKMPIAWLAGWIWDYGYSPTLSSKSIAAKPFRVSMCYWSNPMPILLFSCINGGMLTILKPIKSTHLTNYCLSLCYLFLYLSSCCSTKLQKSSKWLQPTVLLASNNTNVTSNLRSWGDIKTRKRAILLLLRS